MLQNDASDLRIREFVSHIHHLADILLDFSKKINIIFAQEVKVGFSTGWFGEKGQIVMTVELSGGEDFAQYVKHPYHADYLVNQGKICFESYSAAQFEY